MGLKIITSYDTLIAYAREEVAARKSGDPERIARAVQDHKDYHAACVASDEMHVRALLPTDEARRD